MPLRTVFAGTPEFAVPTLKALMSAGHPVCAVYTQPDRPAGRGRVLRSSPIKRFALSHGLAIAQPASLKHEADRLRALRPEIMVVVAYGLRLPRSVLEVPVHGCVNVHASLLPRWRGAAPIQRAIEAGDAVTGVTIMQMDEGLDTGDILAQAQTPIQDADTAQTLHGRLARLGAETLVATLARLEKGKLEPRPQDGADASYAAKLTKREVFLDWRQPAAQIVRKVRALNPWPMACTEYHGEVLRLWEAITTEAAPAGEPGTVVGTGQTGIDVCAGDGVVRLLRLQLAGGRSQSAGEFLNGRPIQPGERLGRSLVGD